MYTSTTIRAIHTTTPCVLGQVSAGSARLPTPLLSPRGSHATQAAQRVSGCRVHINNDTGRWFIHTATPCVLGQVSAGSPRLPTLVSSPRGIPKRTETVSYAADQRVSGCRAHINNDLGCIRDLHSWIVLDSPFTMRVGLGDYPWCHLYDGLHASKRGQAEGQRS